MIFCKIDKKAACDMPLCSNRADYQFRLGDGKRHALNLCAECARAVHGFIAAETTPKSPPNMLNRDKKGRYSKGRKR